jgi:hypothetical protein
MPRWCTKLRTGPPSAKRKSRSGNSAPTTSATVAAGPHRCCKPIWASNAPARPWVRLSAIPPCPSRQPRGITRRASPACVLTPSQHPCALCNTLWAATGAASHLPAPHAQEEETLPGDPGQRSQPPGSHTCLFAQRHGYLDMGGDPFLSTPRLWTCLRMTATTFLPCCLIIPRISSRHGIRPLRRGCSKSIAATAHAFNSCCVPRLSLPELDCREADALVEMGHAGGQPWEEGQRIYRQPLETHGSVGGLLYERSVNRRKGATLRTLRARSRVAVEATTPAAVLV